MSQNLKAAGGTLLLSAAFTANGGKGEAIQCDIQWDPKQSTQKLVYIPTSEVWQITDVYTTNATNATTNNPQLEFYKDTDRKLDVSRPLGTVIITNTQRPNGLNADLRYEGGSQLSITAIALENNTSAATANAQAPYEKQ